MNALTAPHFAGNGGKLAAYTRRLPVLALLWPLVMASLPAGAETALRFAVVAYRPLAQVQAHWQPLGPYLSDALERKVEVVVYTVTELEAAIRQGAVDAVLTNPGQYMELRHRYGASAPLATVVVREGLNELTSFGGVIFARADATGINTLADLKKKKVATISMTAFGAYQAQAYAMLEAGLSVPDKGDLLIVGESHDQVAAAVLDGRAEVGFVRTGVLEAMVREGRLDLSRLRILNRQNLPTFPYLSSTRLYPEWPVAVMPQVDDHMARRLTVALLSLEHSSTASRLSDIHGFTVPLDYSGVEQILRRLRMPPYDVAPEFTLTDLWSKYREWLLVMMVLAVWLLGLGVALVVQNRRVRQSKRHLLALKNDLQATLSAIPDLMFEIGLNGLVHACRVPTLAALRVEPGRFIGKRCEELWSPGVATGVLASLQEAHETGYSAGYQCELAIGSERRWFELSVARKDVHAADEPRLVVLARDMTERKLAEDELKLAASVFTHAREGIMITDAAGTILKVNDTFTRITGYASDEAVGQNPRLLNSGRQSREHYVAMWQALAVDGHWSGEVWNRRKSGEVYAEFQTVGTVFDDRGNTRNYVALFTDITSMKQDQQRLEHIAHYDALTGLPNRVLLADRLQQAMLRSLRHKCSVAVVFLDLDGFKAINDNHGHDVGDELLLLLARRIKSALREGDTLARIGGDEFVAVLADLAAAQDCEPVLDRMLLAASSPVTIPGETGKSGDRLVQVSASMGITLYPQDGADADQLMRHADQAMYLAKQAGKNRYQLFDLAQNAAVTSHHEAIAGILHALHGEEFELFYQPKINMRTGEVVGAEALIRWNHPERGLLAPGFFLPAIENEPASVNLGEWAIHSALAQMAQWQAQGLDLLVSVNVAAHQLQQAGFGARLTHILARHPAGLAARLELEVLETSALQDIARVSEIMRGCLALGVRFALDDFGTGYSSLTYLKRLPIQVLKIDQSFVRYMLEDPEALAIVKGIIGLAETFGRGVIAEGVETRAHGARLLALGCEHAQGYGIARPMPASQLPGWIANWQKRVGTSWVQAE